METGSGKENQQMIPAGRGGMLSDPHFHQLADMPSEAEWFFDIHNHHTKRAYRKAIADFQRVVSLGSNLSASS